MRTAECPSDQRHGVAVHALRVIGALCFAVPLMAQSPAPRPGAMGVTPPGTTRRPDGGTLARTSAFGALSGTVLAMGYYFLSEKGTRSSGCQPLDCALPFLAGSGAIAGLFIGRELDAQRRAFAPRAGEVIEFGFGEGKLLAPPSFIDVRDSLIAVVSDSGVQLLSATPAPKALRRRANGLSALRQVAIVPARGSLVLGTGTALWEASLLAGPATRLADGPVDALAANGDVVVSASGKRLRVRFGSGDMARGDSLELPLPISSVAYDSISRAWWVATDSQLVQVTTNDQKLALTAVRLTLPASARAIATSAEWIAVAMGDEGVMGWRRDSLASALVPSVRVTQEPRFAYDLAFLGPTLFVAGGVDGLFQLSLSPVPRVVGSSRQLQFATTVRAGNGVLWVGDRNRVSVVRVTP
ncbi:MAG: hypothetical protein IPP90_00455 [Gemmatimonadaceae bacterium]|nr:hypothetical protein [Gemmatimonadaceae bacterium]